MSRASQPSIRALEQARARLQEQLAASPEDAKLLLLCARAEERLGAFEEAAQLYQRAAKVYRTGGDRAAEADAWLETANAYAQGRHVAKARTFFQRAVMTRELLGDDAETVKARLAMARFQIEAKAPAEARQQLERCVEPLEAQGAYEDVGWVHEQLMEVLRDAGDLQGALDHAKEAVEAAAKAKDRTGFGARLSAVAALHRALGNRGKAKSYQEKALPYLREAGDRKALLGAYDVLVELALEQDDLEKAEAWLAEAVLVADGADDPGAQGMYRAKLGELVASRGDDDQARKLLEQAVERLHRAGDPHSSGPAHHWLAVVLERLGKDMAAVRAYERAEAMYRMVGDEALASEVAATRARVSTPLPAERMGSDPASEASGDRRKR